MEIHKKVMILTDMHEKSTNKFARSGIASQGTAIHMGAKTGRGTGFDAEFKYVLKNTLDPQKEELRKALHSLASLHPQNISYTSVVVTKLHAGQEVGPHRDVKNLNGDSIPNHTICFGNFEGGLFQVTRQTESGSDALEIIGLARTWVSFYAKSLRHKVSE
eukprot:5923183-Amphidinium_carterae.1